ncbi:hypothetical protein CEE69_22400 [Rhodopirellula bahusiensis]|uniref:Uncharacterized protein n=1 Tax=Rhodopirellula bahusiensis TaxID=2014065 RepID=A0A2G1W1T0_9BACT|nr:hypothetical protein CEE69_22400 [Rhodopirellula bahusiensis]
MGGRFANATDQTKKMTGDLDASRVLLNLVHLHPDRVTIHAAFHKTSQHQFLCRISIGLCRTSNSRESPIAWSTQSF